MRRSTVVIKVAVTAFALAGVMATPAPLTATVAGGSTAVVDSTAAPGPGFLAADSTAGPRSAAQPRLPGS